MSGRPFFDQPAALRSQVASNTYATAAENTEVSIALTVDSGYRRYLPMIIGGYDGDPTGGRLTISGIEGNDITFPITRGGPFPLITPPLVGRIGVTVTLTLAAGGPGVTGELNVQSASLPAYHRLDGAPLP